MGIARKVGKGVGGFVFTLSLSFLIFSIAVAQLTEYENMKAFFSDIFSSQIGALGQQVGLDEETTEGVTEEQLEELYQTVLQMCEGEQNIQVSITETGTPITLDCDEVRALEESVEAGGIVDIIGDAAAAALFDNIYYKEFDCGFVECVQTGQFDIMLSAQGHEFFNGIKMYLIAAVVVSAVIIFVSAETWPDRMKGFGTPLIFIGFSYVMLKLIKSKIISQFPLAQEAEQIGISVAPIVDKIIAPMSNTFLIALVVGVVLTLGAYALEYKEKRKATKRR